MKVVVLLVVAVVLAEMLACDGQTITELVVADATLTSLETAVIAAGLAATLNEIGPFTVFAPNDDAFAAIGNTTAALIESANEGTKGKDALKAILLVKARFFWTASARVPFFGLGFWSQSFYEAERVSFLS